MPTQTPPARTVTGLSSELRSAVMRLRRRLASEQHPDNPLSIGSMAVLGELFRHGDSTIGELAAREQVKAPSMTRTINCLEEEGYVVRRPHETDGRQVVVSLSDLGRSALMADRARRDAWLAQRLRDLDPEERETLRRAVPVLQRLARED